MRLSPDAKLYGIADFGYVAEADMEKVTAGLLAGGVDVLQLRAKGIPLDVVAAVARKLIPLCHAAGVPFVLNDHVRLALDLGADGVHVGQDDGSIDDVRGEVGEGMIIGRSTHSLPQARQALADGADYIGFGPLYPTPTKAGRPSIGLQDVAEMEREVGSKIPAFCIGGIKPENLDEVFGSGAVRCVVVSHLLTASDIRKETAILKARFAEKT